MRGLLVCLLMLASGTPALAGAGGAPPSRTAPVWGLYASMQLPSTKWDGVDPCDIVYTVAWVLSPNIVPNLANGRMVAITPFVGVTWDAAQAALKSFGKYFDDGPDGVVKFAPCRPAVAPDDDDIVDDGSGAGGGPFINLTGSYTCLVSCGAGGIGNEARIEQSGDLITFINEGGGKATGRFVERNTVVAVEWGNLRAIVSGDAQELRWANGTIWRRR